MVVLLHRLLDRRSLSLLAIRRLGTFGEITKVGEEDKVFVVKQGEGGEGVEARPVVVVFGWAGAKHKHLDKYSQLYR